MYGLILAIRCPTLLSQEDHALFKRSTLLSGTTLSHLYSADSALSKTHYLKFTTYF